MQVKENVCLAADGCCGLQPCPAEVGLGIPHAPSHVPLPEDSNERGL